MARQRDGTDRKEEEATPEVYEGREHEALVRLCCERGMVARGSSGTAALPGWLLAQFLCSPDDAPSSTLRVGRESPGSTYEVDEYIAFHNASEHMLIRTRSEVVSVGDGFHGACRTGSVEPALVRLNESHDSARDTERDVTTARSTTTTVASGACGACHSLLLDTNGRVWGSGASNSGQLATLSENPIGHATRPVMLTGLRSVVPNKIVQVAAGQWHSLFRDEKGLCFASGSGEKGQLGVGSAPNSVAQPQAVLTELGAGHPIGRVRHIFAAGNVSGFVVDRSSDGLSGDALFMCGENVFSQLGVTGTQRLFATPVPIPRDKQEPLVVRDIATSGYHTMVVCGDGRRVLAFGWNAAGRCGVAEPVPIWDHVPVATDVPLIEGAALRPGESVQRVALGWTHSLLLTDAGSLLGCGSNMKGQLWWLCPLKSHLGLFDRFSWGPTPFRRVVNVSCCQYSTFVLFDDGQCLAFGSNQSGLLGLRERGQEKVDPVEMPYVWRAREWHRSLPLTAYPLAFRVALRYAVLAWRSPRSSQQRVWRRAGTGHVPLVLLTRAFAVASLPLESWKRVGGE